ncbi:MAG: hypothetical protein WBO48_03510, partial [Candidatus Promineifilaceae bacterium]
MNKDRFELGKMPRLSIECHGDLVIRGWAETAVLIRSGQYETREDDNGLNITSHTDLKLNVPHET